MRPARRRALGVGLSVLLAGATALLAQAPAAQAPGRPSFRAETTLIEVDAVVTDMSGNAVRGLAKEDFTILEDGRPQPVANLSFVDVPFETAPPPVERPPVADVTANDTPFEGRVYVLILDDLQVEQAYTRDVVDQATLFISRYFQHRDLMAVVYTSGRKDVGQDFTNNRQLLLAAVGRFAGRRPLIADTAPLALGAPPAGRGTRGGPPAPDLRDPTAATVQADRTNRALSTLKFLKDLADWTNATMPAQHKSLVFFSQGVGGLGDADPDTLFLNASGSRIAEAIANVVAAATRANASIFAVDPRGLSPFANGAGHFDDPPPEGHTSLQVLAEDTGGRAILRTNNLDAAFERVVKDASAYYVLAFAVPPDRRAGSFHTIAVRVNRPGVEVRARIGYRVAGGAAAPVVPATPAVRVANTSDELQAALSSPLPALGVSLSVSSVAFKGSGRSASVLLVTEIGGLTPGDPDAEGRLRDEVEVTSLVLGTNALKGSRTDRVRLALLPETAANTQGAVRVLHRFDLAPGTYQVRIAARDGNSGRVGSVFHDLEVPDFGQSRLAMSGVLVTSTRAGEVTTPVTDVRMANVLESPPSAGRQFARNDEVTVFAEVYDANRSTHNDLLTTRIVNAAGRVVVEGTETVPSDRVNGGRTNVAYPYKMRLRLNSLPPGAYVLRLEVTAQAKGNPTASREIAFTIG